MKHTLYVKYLTASVYLESGVGDLHQEIFFNSEFQPHRLVTKPNLQKTINVPRRGDHKTFADFF